MSQPPAILILGYGPQTSNMARAFTERGCTVVISSQSLHPLPEPPPHETEQPLDLHSATIDLSVSDTLASQLEAARIRFLGPERWFSAVIYHGPRCDKAHHLGAILAEKPNEVLSLELGTMKLAAETDVWSVWVVAQFAIRGFDAIVTSDGAGGEGGGRTGVFIVTGNAMPFQPASSLYISLGYARVTQRYLIEYLALHQSIKSGGREQFYYAYQDDTPSIEGDSAGQNIDPSLSVPAPPPALQGRIEAYWTLVQSPTQRDWHVRFDATGHILPNPNPASNVPTN